MSGTPARMPVPFINGARINFRPHLRLALAGFTVILLAGCGTDASKIDTTLSSDQAQTIYAISCGTIGALSAGFDAYVAANPEQISQKAQNYVTLAKAALIGDDGKTAICTPPYPTSIATLTTKLTGALTNLYLAYKEQGLDPKVTIAPATQTAAAQ